MHTLIISILCSVAVSVLLKMARTRHIHIAQAIAVNYIVASTLCVVLLQPAPASLLNPSTPWWVLIALGVLLPSVFIAMAAAVRYAGIVLSDAAQRLSLLIPLMAAFVLFGESVSWAKGSGVALALLALVMLLIKPGHASGASETGTLANPKQREGKAVAFLLCVWIGYGVIDILFKHLARSGAAFSSSLLVSFMLAGIMIIGWLTVTRTSWRQRSVIAGLVLGLLNFGNIYFYVRAHQTFPDNPTLVFSAMNIGVIAVGAIVGAGVFKEPLNRLNIAGVALAMVAIVLLVPR